MKFPPGPRAKVLLKLIFSMKTCLIFQINICARCELCQTVTMCSLLYYLHVAKLFPLAPFLFSFNQLSHLLFKFTSFFQPHQYRRKEEHSLGPSNIAFLWGSCVGIMKFYRLSELFTFKRTWLMKECFDILISRMKTCQWGSHKSTGVSINCQSHDLYCFMSSNGKMCQGHLDYSLKVVLY